jgi:uncharacterized membrane protein
MAVAGRELGGSLDTFEIMMYRSLVGVIAVFTLATVYGTWGQINRRDFGTQIGRNLAHFTGQNLWFYAVTVIPLAQVFALEFTSPLWVIVLSPLILGERLTKVRALAAVLGFIGILCVARPTIAGLNAGADDYLVKPFDLHELSARLLAVARRYSGNPNPLIRLSGDNGGAIEVDLASRSVVIDGQQTDLTSREWALLDQLLRRPGATLSKAQLEEALYEFGAEIESNTVEVYVSRLRRKLGKAVIHTVRGVGYRIEG